MQMEDAHLQAVAAGECTLHPSDEVEVERVVRQGVAGKEGGSRATRLEGWRQLRMG